VQADFFYFRGVLFLGEGHTFFKGNFHAKSYANNGRINYSRLLKRIKILAYLSYKTRLQRIRRIEV
jgi:hypothetical protein